MAQSNPKYNWSAYAFLLSFSLYWLSNLILWIPWTINPKLGITLMLTINPVLWGFGAWYCLARFQGKIIYGGIATGLIFVLVSVVADFIFIGLIRNSFNNLYQPTTFYGYGFVMAMPVIEALLLKKVLAAKKTPLTKKDFVFNSILGAGSFLLLMLIIKLNI